MPSVSESRAFNAALFDMLSTPGMEKAALNEINEFTYLKLREGGVFRKVLPPISIPYEELDRQYFTDNPAKVIDKEPDNPPAVTLPFGASPSEWYIRGERYLVLFDRIFSPEFAKDIVQLQTWAMDIRQVISDNAVKDMLAEEDAKFFGLVNTALVGPNTPLSWAGNVALWRTLGSLGRKSIPEAKKIMNQTPFSLEPVTAVVNHVTLKELEKWHRDEIGGNLAENIVLKGWTEEQFFGLNVISTIKRNLVPDNTMYLFAATKFMGKNFELEPPTMYIDREGPIIRFMLYQSQGSTIANAASLCRVDFV